MEKVKVLKPCTIVPAELYVERDADRQIRTILEDMERPGYVLDARQMGKTNLLLHTKKIFENEKNIFVYVDFSYLDSLDERNCFETIINTALDAHYILFTDEKVQIEELRAKQTISSQMAYTNELRILLRKVDKLVLILDEIDALTRTSYSDKVFSQIRGHYFQRVNFPELSKLTYILSGVVEPKNIIKDPNISPFNIGQKIYIRDFNLREYRSFMRKIQFEDIYKNEIIDRIYYWTKGHPRLTWDLCLEIENTQNVKTVEQVDDIVKSCYLTEFDKAPIDSIRDMVRSDESLRDAVIVLSYKKGSTISDMMKSKLYLAGIIEYEKDNVNFKNPILEKSLSYDWLLKLQTGDKNYIELAEKKLYIEGSIKEAIQILVTLSKSTMPKDIDRVNYLLADAYFRQYQNDESFLYLDKISKDSNFYEQGELLRAYILQNEEKYDSALLAFKGLIELSKNKNIIIEAKLGSVEVLLDYADHNHLRDAEKLLKDIFETPEEISNNIHLATIIHYNLARVHYGLGNKEEALKYIETAFVGAQENEILTLFLAKFQFLSELEDKKKVLKNIVDIVSRISNKPPTESFNNKLAFNIYIFELIFVQCAILFPEYIDIITPKLKWIFDKKEDSYNFICLNLNLMNNELAVPFADHILMLSKKEEWSFTEDHIITAYSVKFQNIKDKHQKLYLAKEIVNYIYNTNYNGSLQINIAQAFILVILDTLQKDEIQKSKLLITCFERNFAKFEDEVVQEYMLLMHYYKAFIASQNLDFENFYKEGAIYIKEVNNKLSSENICTQTVINENTMKSHCQQLHDWGIDMRKHRDIFLQNKWDIDKFKRNTKLRVHNKINDQIIDGKYKSLKTEIESGFYEIIMILSE